MLFKYSLNDPELHALAYTAIKQDAIYFNKDHY